VFIVNSTTTETHGYGFLWLNTCTYTAYYAQGAMLCQSGHNNGVISAAHGCKEVHGNCGAGTTYPDCPDDFLYVPYFKKESALI